MSAADIAKGLREGWLVEGEAITTWNEERPPSVWDRWWIFKRTGARVRVLSEKGLPVT